MEGKDEEGLQRDHQERPALGLRLKKTPSFLNLIQTELELSSSQTGNNNTNAAANNPPLLSHGGGAENHPVVAQNSIPIPSPADFMSQPMSEKLKASNFSATMLTIGCFERVSRHESDLVAKLYYAKRKLVWEFLEGPLKKKIEIQWSDIAAMRATIEDGQPGVWEIELNQPPLFFHETNPQPRKHTLWQPVGDFTNGQASRVRRHYVKFPRGVLDKHYEKLLQCDPRLHMLSQKPFPSLQQQSPNNIFFQPISYQVSDLCLDFQRHPMPNTLILRHPNPYNNLPFSSTSHINIPQNNNWLSHTTTCGMLPPDNIVHQQHVFNNEAAQSSSSSSSFSAALTDTTLGVYPTHDEYHHRHHMNNTICSYLNNHRLLVNHHHDNQVPTYNYNDQTMVVGNLVVGPNMDAASLSFYPNNNLQNVGQAMVIQAAGGCLDGGGGGGGTLYNNNNASSSPWGVQPSHHHHFTNGDHSPCSTSNSASPPGINYPNHHQDFRHETQD